MADVWTAPGWTSVLRLDDETDEPAPVVVAMTRYRLDARRLRGGLRAPTRDDHETRRSDSCSELTREADELARQGFAVWLYERRAEVGSTGMGTLTVIAEWRDGARLH